MMEAAHRGEFAVIVAWALDRFGRSMVGNLQAVLDGTAMNPPPATQPTLLSRLAQGPLTYFSGRISAEPFSARS